MTKRTTDEWEALLGPELPERIWVEESDWDDEAWDVCVQHPDWGTRASIGSTHRKDVAHLFAASHGAVAEVVRLRRELEERREYLIDALSNESIESYDDLDGTWVSVQKYGELSEMIDERNFITRILEAAADHAEKATAHAQKEETNE